MADDPPEAPPPPVVSPDEYLAAIRLRADQVFADRPVDAAVQKVRAIVGVPHIPDAEVAAQAA